MKFRFSADPPLEVVAPFTQRRCINATAAVHQFSAIGHSQRAKHLRLKDEPLCNSQRKPVLWLLKSRDGTLHDDDICVFQSCFPRVLPVNPNPRIVYNPMDYILL